MKNFKSLCMRLKKTWFAVMFLALNSLLLFAAGSAHAANLVTESFTGASAPYTNWPISGNADFITATQADGNSGTVVKLTDATNNQAGTLVYDNAFSSALTATITFNYFMGGGTGADGFSVFLVDGTTTSVTAGKAGGTLGYGTNYSTINGVPNAYAAVGFDIYGNCIKEFGNAVGTGINNGAQTANNVCIGGSGNLLLGYRYLTGSVQGAIGSATNWRKAEVIVKRGDGSNGCTNGGVCLSVRFSTDNGTTWTTVHTDYRVDNATGQATIPDTFKIGFSGSTGGSNNKHYIDNVQIDLNGYQLDAVKAGTGTGTVTSTSSPTQTTQVNCGATCAVAYPANTAVTLTATPSANSTFAGWSSGSGSASGCSGTGNCTFNITANSGVTATFTLSSAQNNPPSAFSLVYPSNGQTGLGTMLTFRWRPTTDPDGDTVTYDLYFCAGSDPTACSPINVALLTNNNQKTYYAGLDYWQGALLAGIVLAGCIRDRRKIAVFIAVVAISGMLLTSCGDDDISGNNDKTYTASGLSSGTQYSWKVVAKDGKGGNTSSETWTFTTE